MLIFIKFNSKKLLEIFKNLNKTHFPNTILKDVFKSWWFWRILILILVFLMYITDRLCKFYKYINNGMDFFYPSEVIFYLYNSLVSLSIVLTFEIICFLYSLVYDYDCFKIELVSTKTYWNANENKPSVVLYNKISYDENVLKNDLKFLINKFYLINEHQKTFNSYFGPL